MKIQKIKLFVGDHDKAIELAKDVSNTFQREGFTITTSNDFDLGVAIGGDGAFLKMVNESNFLENALYVGINAGTLGFAQDVEIHEIEDFIKEIKQDEYYYEEIGIETIKVIDNQVEEIFHCLNEFVVRNKDLRAFHGDLYINDILLEPYVGDGILVSTSFGSTAYNLSFGGSMVFNDFDTLQITPIAPIHNSSYSTLTHSLILPANKKVTIIPTGSKECILTIDGRSYRYSHINCIETNIERHIRLFRKKNYNYIKKINDKFVK